MPECHRAQQPLPSPFSKNFLINVSYFKATASYSGAYARAFVKTLAK